MHFIKHLRKRFSFTKGLLHVSYGLIASYMVSHKLDEASELHKMCKMFQACASKEYYKHLCLLDTKNDLQLYNINTRGSLHSSQPSEAEIISERVIVL